MMVFHHIYIMKIKIKMKMKMMSYWLLIKGKNIIKSISNNLISYNNGKYNKIIKYKVLKWSNVNPSICKSKRIITFVRCKW